MLLIIGAGAITCSVFAALSCEFIGTKDAIVDDIFPPLTKNIGIFSYSEAGRSCVNYEGQFFDSQFNEFFLTSQLAAIIAPALGTLAWMMVLTEVVCCRCNCGFVFQNVLFLLAFLVQWSTFFIFGQTKFCFSNNSIICEWKLGSILSIAAGGLYYICSILLCCLPRPNPCIKGRPVGDEGEEGEDEEEKFNRGLEKEVIPDEKYEV